MEDRQPKTNEENILEVKREAADLLVKNQQLTTELTAAKAQITTLQAKVTAIESKVGVTK